MNKISKDKTYLKRYIIVTTKKNKNQSIYIVINGNQYGSWNVTKEYNQLVAQKDKGTAVKVACNWNNIYIFKKKKTKTEHIF